MIKIYLDWNVIAQMKGGYHKELLDIILTSNKFIIPYSTSHIGDIFSSYSDNEEQKRRIEEDLDFITRLTKNSCLSNNGKDIFISEKDPKPLLEQRVNQRDLLNNFSLDTIEKLFGEDELTKGIGKTLIDLLKSIPLDNSFKEALENPESGEYLNQMFPDLKENPTMDGFFKSFGKMIYNLNEKEDYKILREVTQKGLNINRDRIFNENNPYKIIEKAQEKLGHSLVNSFDNSKNAPAWFNEICNEYIKLDMVGYQEDTIRVKENKRKETFKNTTEDSFHAAFASTCNFYIINDSKSYNKTKQVFEKLEINTLVFKPNEFIDYYTKFLNIEHLDNHFNIAIQIVKSDNYYESEVENGVLRTYIFPYFIFDFFNKIIVINPNNDEHPTIMLSKFSPTNGNVTYIVEIEKLVTDLINLFGLDDDKIGCINNNELASNEWIGRKWTKEDINFRLIKTNGYFQLYFDL